MPNCPKCDLDNIVRNGSVHNGKPKFMNLCAKIADDNLSELPHTGLFRMRHGNWTTNCFWKDSAEYI